MEEQKIERAKRFVYKFVQEDNIPKLKQLFEAGMPVDSPLNEVGQTALMLFCQSLNLQGVQQMLEWGAVLGQTDHMGRTALHYLVQVDATGEGTQWLLSLENLKETYDVNAMSQAGVTPLMLAVKLNHEKAVEQLLNAGANPFLKDQLGQEAKDYKVSLMHANQNVLPVDQMLEGAKTQWIEQVPQD